MNLEEQYDRIYRYCYFKVHSREMAEDITQETFLRFLESSGYRNTGQELHYLYTIARNLCIDEYRRKREVPMENPEAEYPGNDMEEGSLTTIAVRKALSALDEADRELLLLRYVNEVPIAVLGELYGISRFAVYRRGMQAVKNLKRRLEKEGIT